MIRKAPENLTNMNNLQIAICENPRSRRPGVLVGGDSPPFLYNSSAPISEIQPHIRQAATAIATADGGVNNNGNANDNNEDIENVREFPVGITLISLSLTKAPLTPPSLSRRSSLLSTISLSWLHLLHQSIPLNPCPKLLQVPLLGLKPELSSFSSKNQKNVKAHSIVTSFMLSHFQTLMIRANENSN
ncbi:hypothetical protein LguiB_032372 [Lonicera macranthoides]